MEEVVFEQIAKVLIGIGGLGAVLMVLAQMFKGLLREEQDGDGNEVGPRRYLAPIMITVGTGLGLLWAFLRGVATPELYLAWAVAGLLSGATSIGFYGGLKSLVPGVFNSGSWLFRR